MTAKHLPISLLALLVLAVQGVAAEPILEDHDRNIHIPPTDELQQTLRVGAVYNDEEFQLRYEFGVDEPSWYHQYWRYEDGDWVRYGSGSPGPDEHHLYEDRISMMLDDGGVDGFDRYGGWMLIHEGMRTLTSAVGDDEVSAHQKLGREMGRSDVRKYLPATRTGEPDEVSWDRLRPDDELDELRAAGYFLDLWQWRAHRSHPVGHADNTLVAHYRLSAEGRSMYTDNWDEQARQPAYMFDPDKVGKVALDWDRLIAREYGQDDPYFLSEDNSVAFDPDHDWQEGDVLPQRFLRRPDGSRGAIRAEGSYSEGAWRVRLTRSLEAPDPGDSKKLADGETYHVAFAVHSGGVGARWHRVSLPLTLGLGIEQADLTAVRVNGDLDEAEVEWHEVGLIYPGQVTWQWLNSDHPGAALVRAGELSVHDQHALEELIEFIVEDERTRLGGE